MCTVVDRGTTVQELCSMVGALLEPRRRDVLLSHDVQRLDDKGQCLLGDLDNIHLCRTFVLDCPYPITIHTSAREELTINIRGTDTLGRLKERIQEWLPDALINEQRLTHNGAEMLYNFRTMLEYEVWEWSQLQLR